MKENFKLFFLIIIIVLLCSTNFFIAELVDECKLSLVHNYKFDVQVNDGATLNLHDKLSYPEILKHGDYEDE